jgi:diacylglycerol O-acyltransferase
MPATARLSALDATFLPPADGTMPTFDELRDHIASRLCRAPRYRQRLAGVPLGLNAPEWVDAENFDIADHVLHSTSHDVRELADMAFSVPLNRQRPLWELWIADELADGRIGVVGKAHHCLVDGIAAVELAGLLLDPSPNPAAPDPESWSPRRAPGPLPRMAGGVRDRVAGQAGMLTGPAKAVRRPKKLLGFADDARRAASALAESLDPAPPAPLLNEPISPLRRLALLSRPLEDLKVIKRSFGTTLNDAVLAVCAGGVRDIMVARGAEPERLKTMVPVNVRGDDAAADLGNRISFIFIDLPCDEPDPVRRLLAINRVTTQRKLMGEPQGADTVLKLAAYSPHWVQHAMTRLVASPRTFNLVVSNIPGPRQPMYMRGCRLAEAYPIVPLAERHAVSIGVTTIADRMYFGLYADRKALPDVGLLAGDVDEAIDELLGLDPTDGRHPPASLNERFLSGAPA